MGSAILSFKIPDNWDGVDGYIVGTITAGLTIKSVLNEGIPRVDANGDRWLDIEIDDPSFKTTLSVGVAGEG